MAGARWRGPDIACEALASAEHSDVAKGKIMDKRPWGGFAVLEERDAYKVKRIEVLPGKRLSYQKHELRAEHWMIVQGQAMVTLEGAEIPLDAGQAVDIPRRAAHRIFNPGRDLLVFVEIQTGEYFGEDDIIRLEDDFGRAPGRPGESAGDKKT